MRLVTEQKLYSIVIPTRERADVLRHSIATVLALTRPNFELIVMDNFSSPETRHVVERFGHPQIRYVRAPRRLPMSDNWELGLEHAHGDYVMVLGDDDGIMPDALELAERVHARYPDLILSWMPVWWMWPDGVYDSLRNYAQMHFGSHVDIVDSRAQLRDALASRLDVSKLPAVYNAFVPRAVIERIRARLGRYFWADLPDTCSGIVNLCSTERFALSYRPLAVAAVSRHSTGASLQYNHGDAFGRFEAENRERGSRVDARLSGEDVLIEVRVADVYLKAKALLFPDDDELVFDVARFLRRLCATSSGRFHGQSDGLKAVIDDIARKNALDPADFVPSPAGATNQAPFRYQLMPDQNLATFQCFTDPSVIRNVQDFVAHVARLSVPVEAVKIVDPVDSATTVGIRNAHAVVAELADICRERLALIQELQRTCDERLALIDELQRACDERLGLIHQLTAELATRPSRA